MTHVKVLEALRFASLKHRDQRRKDASRSPYVNHLIDVATILAVAEVDDEEVLAAAILHDTIEDTDTTEGELRLAFGDRVTDLVLEVSDDKDLDFKARKQKQIDSAPSKTPGATLIKLADFTSNLRDLPRAWSHERKKSYVDWIEAVFSRLNPVHSGLEEDLRHAIRSASHRL